MIPQVFGVIIIRQLFQTAITIVITYLSWPSVSLFTISPKIAHFIIFKPNQHLQINKINAVDSGISKTMYKIIRHRYRPKPCSRPTYIKQVCQLSHTSSFVLRKVLIEWFIIWGCISWCKCILRLKVCFNGIMMSLLTVIKKECPIPNRK